MTRALKKLHKWVGLLIGVQVLLWLLSGLAISLLDPGKVNGTQWLRQATTEVQALDETAIKGLAEIPAALLEGTLSIDLLMRHGMPVYLVEHAEGERLLNALDGSLITISGADAEQLARQDFNGKGNVISSEHGMAPDRETRNHKGAYWKVNFSDQASTAIYVSASTGAILERRNAFWRVRDFFWMLHIMDYSDRENFNNPLIISVALIAIWLGISGIGLLFGSFSRADFLFLNIFHRKNYVAVILIDNKTGTRRKLKLRQGSNLFLSLATHKINVASICGGGGECGKCRLKFASAVLPQVNDIESGLIPKQLREQGYRLACQQIVEENMVLHLSKSTKSRGT